MKRSAASALMIRSFKLRTFAAALVAMAMFAAAPGTANGADPIYTGWLSNVAVDGYDPVAFFTEGRPVEGSREFTTEWRGAEWRFASRENLERFEADPVRYAPQYGGYCAWAMASGDLQSGDPRYWRIVDGKLYLNYDADIQDRWEQDIPGFIERADGHWPEALDD